MAFSEKQAYKIEVNEDLSIGVRRADIVLKDDVEVGRTYHRSLFQPGDDVSGEVQEVHLGRRPIGHDADRDGRSAGEQKVERGTIGHCAHATRVGIGGRVGTAAMVVRRRLRSCRRQPVPAGTLRQL